MTSVSPPPKSISGTQADFGHIAVRRAHDGKLANRVRSREAYYHLVRCLAAPAADCKVHISVCQLRQRDWEGVERARSNTRKGSDNSWNCAPSLLSFAASYDTCDNRKPCQSQQQVWNTQCGLATKYSSDVNLGWASSELEHAVDLEPGSKTTSQMMPTRCRHGRRCGFRCPPRHPCHSPPPSRGCLSW